MFNPFIRFEPPYIGRLQMIENHFVISQSYPRGSDPIAPTPAIPILFSGYKDKGLALIHRNAIEHDPYAALIDLNRQRHLNQVTRMLENKDKYIVWWNYVVRRKDVQERLNNRFAGNIRRYIMAQTTWRIGASDTIRPKLECIFGELFVVLKYAKETLRISLSEIEKC